MIRKTLLFVTAFTLEAVLAAKYHLAPHCVFERGTQMSIDHDDSVTLKFDVEWGESKPFFMGG